MNQTPLERRAARRERNKSLVDLNLVSLIDIFTILIFFLLSNMAEVEILPNSRAVKLPESISDKRPRDTVVVVVNATDILVQGRRIASVDEALRAEGDLIAPLKAELDLQAGVKTVRDQPEGQGKAVTIMGDKQIPYRLLRKVMFTCARANFSEVSFAVLRKNEA